jgi:hypothetical protein
MGHQAQIVVARPVQQCQVENGAPAHQADSQPPFQAHGSHAPVAVGPQPGGHLHANRQHQLFAQGIGLNNGARGVGREQHRWFRYRERRVLVARLARVREVDRP